MKNKIAGCVYQGRYSHRECIWASQSAVDQLEHNVKDPQKLLFFRGAQYKFTHNEEYPFSNTQVSIIFEISSQYDLDRFNTFKLPEATPGINSVEFDENTSKDNILYKVLVEVKIGAIW